jgi:hypothetical protein
LIFLRKKKNKKDPLSKRRSDASSTVSAASNLELQPGRPQSFQGFPTSPETSINLKEIPKSPFYVASPENTLRNTDFAIALPAFLALEFKRDFEKGEEIGTGIYATVYRGKLVDVDLQRIIICFSFLKDLSNLC